jgi:hypothetical protein
MVLSSSAAEKPITTGRRAVKTHPRHIAFAVACACFGVALAPDCVSAATNPVASSEASVAQPNLGEKREAIAGVSADASAVLAAIQADPKLLDELARNPAAGGALLRAHGATRSERITVSASGGGSGERKTTITITITIDNVTITIKF